MKRYSISVLIGSGLFLASAFIGCSGTYHAWQRSCSACSTCPQRSSTSKDRARLGEAYGPERFAQRTINENPYLPGGFQVGPDSDMPSCENATVTAGGGYY
jgi:hypothetical protein